MATQLDVLAAKNKATLTIGKKELHGKMCMPPTYIESLKTYDNKAYFKSADICQVLCILNSSGCQTGCIFSVLAVYSQFWLCILSSGCIFSVLVAESACTFSVCITVPLCLICEVKITVQKHYVSLFFFCAVHSQ